MKLKEQPEARWTLGRFGVFLLVALIRGILFLVPIVVIAVLAREGYQMLRRVIQPIALLLPQDKLYGILVEDLLSVTLIVLVFVATGVFVGTRLGRGLNDRLEQVVLYRIPGYLLVQGAVASFPGLNRDAKPEPALVETDDGWAFALVVERGPQGFCTVFLPDAPTPTSGDVRIVDESRVHPLDIPMLSLLACLTRSGKGAGQLAEQILGEAKRGRGPESDGLKTLEEPSVI